MEQESQIQESQIQESQIQETQIQETQIQESQIQESQIQDMLIQDQLLTLVKQIHANTEPLGEMLDTILYNCLCIYRNTKYLSVLYKLIFYTYKHSPEQAYMFLSGFIQFGQSAIGNRYKPLLDYIATEAFEGLFKQDGWAIIKPCLIHFRATIANLTNEPVFKHIIARIVTQLHTDINDPTHNSELCCQLPREKSFTWGWFSRNIAHSYYGDLKCNIKCGRVVIRAKKMRKYLMLYRKLITQLRKNYLERNGPLSFRAERLPFEKATESWKGILTTLATPEYQWADDIITNCMATEAVSAEAWAALKTTETIPSVVEVEEPHTSEAEEPHTSEAEESIDEEPIEIIARPIVNETPTTPEVTKAPSSEGAPPAEAVKNSSWLYSLFGWS